MNNDDLLRKVAESIKEQDSVIDDPYWEALAEGKLDAGGDQLKDEQTRTQHDDLQQLFQPINSESKASIVNSIMQQAESADSPKEKPHGIPNERTELTSLWNGFKEKFIFQAGAGLAFASILTVAFVGLMPQQSEQFNLPNYQVEWTSKQQAYRSTQVPTSDVILLKDRANSITLRPELSHEHALYATVFFEQDISQFQWDSKVKQSSQGVVQINGTFPQEMPKGKWQAHIIVSPNQEQVMHFNELKDNGLKDIANNPMVKNREVLYFSQTIVVK